MLGNMKMFISSSGRSYFKLQQEKLKVPIYQLCKNRKARARAIKMEIKNLRLIVENKRIIEDNEKLRKRAVQLHQENKELLSQFYKGQ